MAGHSAPTAPLASLPPCPTCGQFLPHDTAQAHELVHAQDTRLEGLQPWLSDDEIQLLYWEELKARHNLEEGSSVAGACRLCGSTEHWVQECSCNPDNIAAQERVIDPPTRNAILLRQRPDVQWRAGEGANTRLVELIAECLGAGAPAADAGVARPTALLCAAVRPFGGQRHDIGWGCGYRNMQMQAASLLVTRDDARAVLFGGCGYVPDIASLQAWIECAWRAGFSPGGGQALGYRLQARHSWVGTSECAALLRYFGMQATVIDFGVDAEGALPTGGPGIDVGGGSRTALEREGMGSERGAEGPQRRGDGSGGGGGGGGAAVAMVERVLFGPGQGQQEQHTGVECDGCGARDFRGPRYRSAVLRDFDLCEACYQLQCHPGAAPFCRVPPPDAGAGAAVAAAQVACSSLAQVLMEWVWRYFAGGGAYGSGAGEERPPAGSMRVAAPPPPGVNRTARPPLYFQHEGHSRTIAGIERRETPGASVGGPGARPEYEYSLLVVDPAVCPAALAAALRARHGWERLLKRGAHTLRHAKYQLLYCADMAPAPPGTVAYNTLKQVESLERNV